jgi:hypothetical protein
VSLQRANRAACSATFACRYAAGGQIVSSSTIAHRLRVAGERPRVEQAREHARVLARECAALRGRAHGVAGLERDVPQTREKRFERARLALQIFVVAEHEQVDVGKRKQQAAAVAAGREQRAAGRVAEAGAPDVGDDGIDGGRAAMHERAGVSP